MTITPLSILKQAAAAAIEWDRCDDLHALVESAAEACDSRQSGAAQELLVRLVDECIALPGGKPTDHDVCTYIVNLPA